MLKTKTILKVLSLPQLPCVSHVQIATGHVVNPTHVAIYSEDNSSLEDLFSAVKDIFPKSDLSSEEPTEMERYGGRKVIWSQFLYTKNGDYELSVNHYETKEKPSAPTEGLKEIETLDYITAQRYEPIYISDTDGYES